MSIFFSFLVVSQDLLSKIIINVAINHPIILLFFIKKVFIFEIPVRRKILSVSPATNILIIHPRGKT